MARGAKEPSAKRAKVDEADKEEVVCFRLPPELWEKIVDENLHQNDLLALAMTCRFFRDTTKNLGKKLETNVDPNRLLDLRRSGKVASQSLGWFRWVYDTFQILPGYKWIFGQRVKGAVYEGDLVNYAAFQGSVEIMRWLLEEKGCELNKDTDERAGMSGSVEILEYLKGTGCEFNEYTCQGAARGGCLEALKFLRGLDPPCTWDEWTCGYAARLGHLEVLKWARSQDPPCPWYRDDCGERVLRYGHPHIIKWIDQQED